MYKQLFICSVILTTLGFRTAIASAVSLNQAYNQGNTINTTSDRPVTITGFSGLSVTTGIGGAPGVSATSDRGYGVQGFGIFGVYGEGLGYGVFGTSHNGFAVEGVSDNANGDLGTSAVFTGGKDGNGTCSYAGGADWVCTSDRNLKENFTAVNAKDILQKVIQLTVTRWNMKGEDPTSKHIGPTAQDFQSIFKLSKDDKVINRADIQGVTLAAIQGLYQLVQEKNAKLHEQEVKITQLQEQVAVLKKDEQGHLAALASKVTMLEKTMQASSTPVRSNALGSSWQRMSWSPSN